MTFNRRRKAEENPADSSISGETQNQFEFDAQPDSYEASESISNDGDDYSAEESGYTPVENDENAAAEAESSESNEPAEADADASSESAAGGAEPRKIKIVRPRRKVAVKAAQAASPAEENQEAPAEQETNHQQN